MIRLFTPSDMDRILEIEAQAFPKSPYSRGIFTSLYRSNPGTFLVYGEDEILAYLVYRLEGHIISIAVDSRHRRRGIGTRLIREAIVNSTGDFIWAEVRKSNTGAQAFYEKLGFRKQGCRIALEGAPICRKGHGNEGCIPLRHRPTPCSNRA